MEVRVRGEQVDTVGLGVSDGELGSEAAAKGDNRGCGRGGCDDGGGDEGVEMHCGCCLDLFEVLVK